MATPARIITPPFRETFTDVISESSNPDNSEHGDWYVSSGGYANVSKGALRTNNVDLQPGHRWHDAYATNIDCEGGSHPENVFRLPSRDASLLNFTMSARFKVTRISTTDSPNRTGDKGIFLMTRYVDSNTLLYSGVRFDGQAVIKAKVNGVYHTLGIVPWFPGTYDRDKHPSLLPVNAEFGLQVAVKSIDNQLSVTFSIADPGVGYRQALAIATGEYPQLCVPGKVGLRGDFSAWETTEISIT